MSISHAMRVIMLCNHGFFLSLWSETEWARNYWPGYSSKSKKIHDRFVLLGLIVPFKAFNCSQVTLHSQDCFHVILRYLVNKGLTMKSMMLTLLCLICYTATAPTETSMTPEAAYGCRNFSSVRSQGDRYTNFS